MSLISVLFLGIAVLLSAAAALGLYYFPRNKKSVKLWKYFSVLRFFTVLVGLILLINPKFEQNQVRIEKPNLVVVSDNSKSVRFLKGEKQTKRFLQELLQDQEIKEAFNVKSFTFDEELHFSRTPEFSGNASDPGKALKQLARLYPESNSPLILITDGNATQGTAPVYAASKYQSEIFPVVVGDTTQHADVYIDLLNVNPYAFLDQRFPVEIFVNYQGDVSVQSKLLIKKGTRVVHETKLSFSSDKQGEQVEIMLPAKRIGKHKYTASITPLNQEKNIQNNQRDFFIEVVDQQSKVLILSSFLHPDLGALKKSINSNKQRQAHIKIIDELKQDDLSEYTNFVLYQPNQNFEWVFDYLDKTQKNYLLVGGTKTDYNFLNGIQSSFRKELKINQNEEFQAQLNENFSLYQPSKINFLDYPPLSDQFGEISNLGKGQALLQQNINGVATQQPVVYFVDSGQRRIGLVFGENLWQWRVKNFADLANFEAFDLFINDIIQFLGDNNRGERLKVEMKTVFNQGEPIRMQAQYVDKNYREDAEATINLRVVKQEDESIQNYSLNYVDGNYVTNLGALAPGSYTFTAQVEGENSLQTGDFVVTAFDIEEQFNHAQVSELNKISDTLYYSEDFLSLKTKLLQTDIYKPVQRTLTKKVELIEFKWLLGLWVLLLSLEWFLRKYNGLT